MARGTLKGAARTLASVAVTLDATGVLLYCARAHSLFGDPALFTGWSAGDARELALVQEWHAKLEAAGAQLLVANLPHGLKRLRFKGKELLGAVCAAAVQDKLPLKLKALDLSDAGLEPEDAARLGKTLSANASMATLNLARNNIGPTGAKEIAEYVQGSAALSKLDVRRNNDIGDEGKQALRSAAEGRAGFELKL